VKGDHQVGLAGNAAIQSVSFDRGQAEDPLYNWSSLRYQYLAEANLNLASEYAGTVSWLGLVLGRRLLGLYLAAG
jgi:hypothetical protein